MRIILLEPFQENITNNSLCGPLGLIYIVSYLEQNIEEKLEISVEVDVNRAIAAKPDIIGISSYTQAFFDAVSAGEKIKKELNIPVIIGGKHITALPSNLKSCFDIGVIGEGEIAMAELVKTYIEKKGFFAEDLCNIQGIVFREGKEIHITPERVPSKDLDIFPSPKRSSLWAMLPGTNKKSNWHQTLYTSRGCPYKCPFCVNSKKKFFTVRFHSPERVVNEIQEIVSNYPQQKYIAIHDDLFVISKKRLKQIVELIKSEKLNRKITFTCMCKADNFDEEIAFLLKEMNVKSVAFGFESGDQDTLSYLKADGSKIQENIDAINICDKYGIFTTGYFITGSPPETKEGLTRTYWFIRQHFPPMKQAGTFFLKPYPGTKTWDFALEKGVVNEETGNWKEFNYYYSNDNDSLFLNENYDFNFFKEASYHFRQIHKRDRIFSNNKEPHPEEKYYNEIYNHLKKYDFQNERVLEIGNQYFQSIKFFFESDISIFDNWVYFSPQDKIKEYEEKVLGNNKFDVIVFNHSLEQILNPYKKLEYFVDNYLNNNGKLIIIVKNIRFIQNIQNLLYGQWEVLIKGFKRFDDFFYLNIDELKKNLKNIGINNIEQISLKDCSSNYSDIYNSIIPVISSGMFINNYLSTAGFYSFLLIGSNS